MGEYSYTTVLGCIEKIPESDPEFHPESLDCRGYSSHADITGSQDRFLILTDSYL